MRLTGIQIATISDVADGDDVTLIRQKGDPFINVHRLGDGYKVRIEIDGQQTILQEPNNE